MTVNSDEPLQKIMGDVPVPVKVQCDVAHIAVKDIAGFKKGTVITFDKVVGESMDVLFANNLMARGEVVVVNNRYGIRLSEVLK